MLNLSAFLDSKVDIQNDPYNPAWKEEKKIFYIYNHIIDSDVEIDLSFFDAVNNKITSYYKSTTKENIIIKFIDCTFSKKVELDCTFKESLDNPDDRICKKLIFENCIFSKLIFKKSKETGIDLQVIEINGGNIDSLAMYELTNIQNKILFNKQTYKNDKKLEIANLEIRSCMFNESFTLENSNVLIIYLSDVTFEKNVSFEDTTFNEGIIHLASYNEKGEFVSDIFVTNKSNPSNNKIMFDNIKFEDTVSFDDTKFCNQVIFNKVIFNEVSHFKKAIFEKGLNLDNTNIQKDINFFDTKGLDTEISKNNTSRESYRIIKHNFEKLGNKIEANKYHALELEQRKRELENELSKNWKEYLVFKIHELSSEHSTNWLLSLSWIIIVGTLTTIISKSWLALFCLPLLFVLYKLTYIVSNIKAYNIALVGIILFVLSILNVEDNFKNMALINLTNSYFIFIGDVEKNELNTWQIIVLFFNKISLGYLYYQFLMSVRKDTRK